MYVINYLQREEHKVELPGSSGATVRWLIGKVTGARTYAMRYFEIAPGGKIPLHNHAEEHEIFVLGGSAELLGAPEPIVAKKDDVIFIAPNEPHGYDNSSGSEPFRFICVIPLLEKKQ
ncbi:MAG: cupin domain-containing protein [Candidatus Thorarchaeota archaeon]